jgi:hypothetical protein
MFKVIGWSGIRFWWEKRREARALTDARRTLDIANGM